MATTQTETHIEFDNGDGGMRLIIDFPHEDVMQVLVSAPRAGMMYEMEPSEIQELRMWLGLNP